MYCPSCGSEERQLSQFCRACGTDLRAVRTSILVALIPTFIVFMVGIGIIVNGLLFTLPRKELPGATSDTLSQQALDAAGGRAKYEPPLVAAGLTNELGPGTKPQLASVTEHTTHHLKTGK